MFDNEGIAVLAALFIGPILGMALAYALGKALEKNGRA